MKLNLKKVKEELNALTVSSHDQIDNLQRSLEIQKNQNTEKEQILETKDQEI